jgi:hypothetical protein
MKAFFVTGCFFLILLAAGEVRCLAADGTPINSPDDRKAQVATALRTKRVLQITLKNSAVVKGTVQAIADDRFTLKEFDSQFLREILFAEMVAVKEQSRFQTAMKNTAKVLNFIFLTRTGLILTTTALTVARLIIINKRIHPKVPVLVTR